MKEKIKEIMRRVFEEEMVEDDISQKKCFKWDSMRHLNLVVEIEEEFNLIFEPEEIALMTSLDKIFELINQKLS